VFENEVLRRTFWPKKEGVTELWRKLHDELNFNPSPDIIGMIKSRKINLTWHVADIGR
jgi:hypothetical protein